MPLVDRIARELLAEHGDALRPQDFDGYWDNSIAEMESLGTGCTLVPAAFQTPAAACFDLWFTGVDGARVHAKYARPKSLGESRPAVVLFHGYHRNSGSWTSLISYVGAGFCALALDCRGQAGLSQDVGAVEGITIRGHILRGAMDPDPRKLLMRAIYLDCAQLARIAMALPEVDAARVAAQGASQGGGLALACAALTPGLNRVAALMPFLCDYRRGLETGNPDGALAELSYYFRFVDPRHLREEAFFERLGYIDNVNLAPRIRASTLLLTGLLDRECPPVTQFAAYNAITAPKRYALWPDYGHEVCPDMEDVAMEFLLEMAR